MSVSSIQKLMQPLLDQASTFSNMNNTENDVPTMMILVASFVLAGIVVVIVFYFNPNKKNLSGRQQYPPHLQSWIPFIGSALELQKMHVRDFISINATKLQAPAFTATIMGTKCLYIANSELISFIFRDSKNLDGLTFQKQFMENVLGFTKRQAHIQLDYESNTTSQEGMKLFHTHLLQDDMLQQTIFVMQDILQKEILKLQLSSPSSSPPPAGHHHHHENDNGYASGAANNTNNSVSSSNNWEKFSLYTFVSTVIFKASSGSLLSMNLVPNHKEILSLLWAFEQGLGMLFVGAPEMFAKEGANARNGLISLFDSDLVRSRESPFLQARRETISRGFSNIKELKGIVDQAIARNNVGVFLAATSNSILAVFWTLLNLMENPAAYEACTEAVRDVASRREAGRESFTLKELDELVVLQSAFQETLRMYQLLFVTRQAVRDFVLNPKDTTGPQYIIEKGTSIMAFPNSMHMDSEIFENPEMFQYDRFVNPNAKSKKGTPLIGHLRPFGGGVHMCPGRKFIGYEIRAFLAKLLLRFEMRLAPGEVRPGIDLTRQGLSVAAPNRDVQMEFRIHK